LSVLFYQVNIHIIRIWLREIPSLEAPKRDGSIIENVALFRFDKNRRLATFGMWFFGKKKKEEPINPEQRYESVAKMVEELDKKINYQRAEIAKWRADARRMALAKNRTGAMNCLKRAKIREAQIERNEGMKFNLETQLDSIQDAETNVKVFQEFRQNLKVIEDQAKRVNCDQVEEVIDNIGEHMETLNETSEILSQAIGPAAAFDAEELDQELDQMLADDPMQEASMEGPASGSTAHADNGDAALEALLSGF
jgi:charged multivesicular body protein 4